MKFMIAHLGRPGTWMVLLFGAFLLFGIVLSLVLGAVRAHLPIDPDEALANGGHVVTVQAWCGENREPLGGDRFEVLSHSGRPPSLQTGHLSGNMVQVVVGSDWIGQVKIIKHRGWGGPSEETTDLIGNAFGWHERQVHFAKC